MARNGSGVFNRLYNWVTDAAGGIKILAARMDAEFDGVAAALTDSIAKDGQTTATANLPMGGFKHTTVANASARDQYAAAGQIQDGALTYAADTGAANAYAIGPTPAFTAYATGMSLRFKAANANTGASTINVNGLGVKTIKKDYNSDLVSGDIIANQIYDVVYDGTNFQITSVVSTSTIFGPDYKQNIGLSVTVGSKALTVAFKTKALADPSAASPVQIAFRNSTLTTGDYVVRNITAATSVVAPSGATLGFIASATGYLYVYALDNAGTLEAILSGSNHWDEGALQSTTAISAAADSRSVLYSTTARTNVPIRFVGRIKIQTGAVAGEWDNEDTEVHVGSSPHIEEGTFTPTLLFGGASVGITYAVQLGNYQRIGSKVTIVGHVATSVKSSSVGTATVGGLPFSSIDSFQASMRINNIQYTGRPQAYANSGSPLILNLQSLLETGVTLNMTDAGFANNSSILFTAEYFI